MSNQNWLRGTDVKTTNASFINKLGMPGEIADLQMEATTFIRTRLRETAVVRHLVPVETVTPDDLDRSPDHEWFQKVIDLEPDSHALQIDIRSDAPGVYIEGKRVAIILGRITSPRFSKRREELMSWEAPITKIIEENAVRDVQEIEDYKWFTSAEQGLYSAANGTHRVNFIDSFDDGIARTSVDRVAIVDTAALLAKNERMPANIVMSKYDIMQFTGLPASVIGDDLASKVTIEGWEYNDLYGMKLIVSIKSVSRQGVNFAQGTGVGDQISTVAQGLAPLDTGRFWIFDEANRLGKFLSLEEANFHIKQEFGLIEFLINEIIGMGILNTGSMAAADLRVLTPGTGTWRPNTTGAIPGRQAYDTTLIA